LSDYGNPGSLSRPHLVGPIAVNLGPPWLTVRGLSSAYLVSCRLAVLFVTGPLAWPDAGDLRDLLTHLSGGIEGMEERRPRGTIGVHRTMQFWTPLPNRYTDLPISYQCLGIRSFVRTRILGCEVAAPLAFTLSLTGCTGHTMTRPYQLVASAFHPTSATTSTVSDLG